MRTVNMNKFIVCHLLLAACLWAGVLAAGDPDPSGPPESDPTTTAAPCNGHGEPGKSTKKCECTGGYTGEKCENAPVCTKNDADSCGGHAKCTDEYTCACTDGYTGDTCEVECNGHGTFDEKCICADGYTGEKCENAPVCAGPDDESCSGHAKCTEYKCVCTDGYTGDTCETLCNGHGKLDKESKCNCTDGYTGEKCETPCNGHGKLDDSANNCNCTDGYIGEKCESCVEESAGVVCQKDYCEECHKKNTAMCVEDRTNRCHCLRGHQPMITGVCLPGCTEDSCTEPNHHCNSTTFKCECKQGYEKREGACKKKCPGGCGAHGICNNGTCFCNDGYFGINCEVTIPCSVRCQHGTCDQEKCTKCKDGYTGDWCEAPCNGHGTLDDSAENCDCTDGYSGDTCEDAPVCTDDDKSCGEHGTCTEYKCVCTDGYTGEKCEVELVCKGPDDGLCGDHGTCNAEHKCDCDDGYTGENCEVECHGHGTLDGSKCRCTDGYTGVTCETLCNGHGKLKGSKCECTDGYSGDTCEVAPECSGPDDDESCGEHKKCNDEYECVCTDGYSGKKCDDKDETSSLPHNFLAYLLVALVVCIVGYVGWHNRHKVLGLVVEGRTGKDRVRSKSSRPSNKDYSRLEENVSDTLSKGSGKTYIF